jgi:hypothetical protein
MFGFHLSRVPSTDLSVPLSLRPLQPPRAYIGSPTCLPLSYIDSSARFSTLDGGIESAVLILHLLHMPRQLTPLPQCAPSCH